MGMNIESRIDPQRPEFVVMQQTTAEAGNQRLLVHHSEIDNLVHRLKSFKAEIEEGLDKRSGA